jgi:hypothetical protein
LWLSSGATNNTVAGSIGVQSGTFAFWGVQLELGSVATPLEKPDPRMDLANCQRFYQINKILWGGYVTSGWTYYASVPHIVSMRTVPTVTVTADSSSSFGARTLVSEVTLVYVSAASNATGNGLLYSLFTASADL